MKKIIFPALLVLAIAACTTQQLQETANVAKDAINTGTKPASNPLTNDEVISGLRDALTVGTNNSSTFASKIDGFYKNPKLFIPFPPEAKKVKDWATKLKMEAQLNKFVETLNRSAEEAAKDAAGKTVEAAKDAAGKTVEAAKAAAPAPAAAPVPAAKDAPKK